jgi:hypothetical protein
MGFTLRYSKDVAHSTFLENLKEDDPAWKKRAYHVLSRMPVTARRVMEACPVSGLGVLTLYDLLLRERLAPDLAAYVAIIYPEPIIFDPVAKEKGCMDGLVLYHEHRNRGAGPLESLVRISKSINKRLHETEYALLHDLFEKDVKNLKLV